MKLFSTSGIRRKVSELPPSLAVNVGLAISKTLCQGVDGEVILARDARLSGPMLEYAINAGLIAGGCNVERKGIIPTPALAYHTYKTNACVGVMLTASHNPPEYNGIKIFDKTSMGLSPEDEHRIEVAVEAGDLPIVSWKDFGEDRINLGVEAYEKMLLDAGSGIDFSIFGSVIADPGGGAGCEVISRIYKELGLELITINALFDPYFSARLSEPVAENLSHLLSFVDKKSKGSQASVLGLAYDGDADRCVAVDDKARFVPLDVLIALYAQYVVEQSSGKKTIVTHVGASMLIDELVEKAGGEVKRTRVGDVAIGNMVSNEKAVFGGEPCGAWIHPEHHLCPDGPLTGIKILGWIAERGPLSSLVDNVSDFPLNRTKVPCEDKYKKTVMELLSEELSSKDSFKSILTIDGIRVSFEDDSWVLIRPSGTESYIRVTAQATTEKESKNRLDSYASLVKDFIKTAEKK